MGKSKKRSDTKGNKKIPAIEWITAAIGLGIVLFFIIFLLFEAKESADKPPDIKIKVIKIIRGGAYYNILINVSNIGQQTAEGVIVEGNLLNGEKVIESSETMFDYIPGQSKKEGGLMFRNDPEKYLLVVKALGFEKP